MLILHRASLDVLATSLHSFSVNVSCVGVDDDRVLLGIVLVYQVNRRASWDSHVYLLFSMENSLEHSVENVWLAR